MVISAHAFIHQGDANVNYIGITFHTHSPEVLQLCTLKLKKKVFKSESKKGCQCWKRNLFLLISRRNVNSFNSFFLKWSKYSVYNPDIWLLKIHWMIILNLFQKEHQGRFMVIFDKFQNCEVMQMSIVRANNKQIITCKMDVRILNNNVKKQQLVLLLIILANYIILSAIKILE